VRVRCGRVMYEAMSCGEFLISLLEGIVIARDGRLPDVAVVGMLGRGFMGLRRVCVTPGSMRSGSVMCSASIRSRCGQHLPGHQQIVAEK
jgi:hypothetical protein